MLTVTDVVAREIGVTRRAEARESVLLAAARLGNRERRIRRRLERIDAKIARHPFGH